MNGSLGAFDDRASMTPAGGASEEAPHDGRASGAPPNSSLLVVARRLKARIRSITRAPDRFTLSDEEWEQMQALAALDMPEKLDKDDE